MKKTIKGKRFSKVESTSFDTDKEFLEYPKTTTLTYSVRERLIEFIDLSDRILAEENKSDEHDSFYKLAERLKKHSAAAANDENKIETRLDSAIYAGELYTQLKVYKTESLANKKNAAKTRPYPDEFIKGVKEGLKLNLSYSQIWEYLKTADAAQYYFDLVEAPDEDKIYFDEKRFKNKPITKQHFIKKVAPKIKKLY